MSYESKSPIQIKTILWDFGGIFTGSPFYGKNEYVASLGLTVEAITELVLGYGLPNGEHPWHKLERGEITMEEAAKGILLKVENAGIKGFDIEKFFKSISGRPEHSNKMYEGVRRLKAKGISQVIVSNNFREFQSIWKSMVPENLFDGIIDSSQVGVRKPDPSIFKLALELVNASPGTTVFLDDYEEHIRVANSIGIRGILVGENPTEALLELETLVG